MKFKTARQRKAVMAKLRQQPIYEVKENSHYRYTYFKPKTKTFRSPLFPFKKKKIKAVKAIKKPTTWQRFEAIGGF
jgi:hypothetical protein